MPTENRSSNTEMVSVLQREDRYIVIKRSDLDKIPGKHRIEFSKASRVAHERMFAAGAPARQFLVIESDWPEYEPTWAAIEARVTGKPAEQHQGEPVALPERKHVPEFTQHPMLNKGHTGWNACLDEIEKPGPLYAHPAQAICAHEWTDDGEWDLTCTKCGKQESHEPYGWVQTRGPAINRFTQEWDVVEEWEDQGIEHKAMYEHPTPADPGEVERLSSVIEQQKNLIASLRAELVESRSIDASAEPSTPVERDERAAYDAWRHSESGYVRPFDRHEWSAWQARAALERKPS